MNRTQDDLFLEQIFSRVRCHGFVGHERVISSAAYTTNSLVLKGQGALATASDDQQKIWVKTNDLGTECSKLFLFSFRG